MSGLTFRLQMTGLRGAGDQPSFRGPRIGLPQAMDQHGEHLDGDLWAAL
jgi:hypothetical protein